MGAIHRNRKEFALEPGKLTRALLGNSWNQLETRVWTSGVGTSGFRTSGVRTRGVEKEILWVKDMKVTKKQLVSQRSRGWNVLLEVVFVKKKKNSNYFSSSWAFKIIKRWKPSTSAFFSYLSPFAWLKRQKSMSLILSPRTHLRFPAQEKTTGQSGHSQRWG